LWAKLCVVFGALLMMGSGGAIIGGKVLINQATSGVTRQNLLGEAGVAPGKAASIKGPINMLLVGLDVRANQTDDSVRADTIVILHIPATHDQAYLVSIPRDTRVKIPSYPKTNFIGYSTKINAAFQAGYRGPGTVEEKRQRGMELLAMTLKELIPGIKFTGAAIIDFEGFQAVLSELGGVYMCVDVRAESIHLAENSEHRIVKVWYDDAAGKVRGIPPGYHPVVHEKGCRRMSPLLALDYSRIRKGSCCPNGDYDRQRHQQQLLKAIAKQAMSTGVITDPGKLVRVMQAAGKAFILDTQGIPVENFLFTLKGVTANELTMIKTNAGRVNTIAGTSDEQLSEASLEMLAAVRDARMVEFLTAHPEFISPG
jgi:LCP family protein required for cell wall assembly